MGMTGDSIEIAGERVAGGDRLAFFLIYSNAFVLGAVVMGFEMLGSAKRGGEAKPGHLIKSPCDLDLAVLRKARGDRDT